MREIKFRAWVQEREKSKSWMNNDMGVGQIFKIYDNDIFMQYTGLKDKNGKEIYEGDIVTCSNKRCWENGEVILRNTAFRVHGFILCQLQDIEIIGNIYENPELLGN